MLEWKEWSFSESIQQGRIFPHLTGLTLTNCPKLIVGLPGSLPSSKHLSIQRCQQTVVLLPIAEQAVTALPSLEAIFVSDCPALESLLEWGDDSKVKEVYVWRSKKLFKDRENWNLQRLSSLEFLNISGWADTRFPDERLLPTSLGEILIQGCSNLEAFNGKAFQQLTSLVKLSIIGCEKLRCLPEEGLPSSLSYLSIQRCPLLKQRCQEGGEDRPKVVHITYLHIPNN